jgi:hypothetical protein
MLRDYCLIEPDGDGVYLIYSNIQPGCPMSCETLRPLDY